MKDASPEMLSIFASAVERPSPEERAAFLDTACGSDAELRGRIEALLRAHDEAGGFLRDRPTAREPVATIDQPAGEGPGSVIGPYKLLEQIGEGGFGVVYMAEQTQPVRRKVALKVLKPGMDTRQVVARFEAERQALAIMDHPHIAKVFDGGVTRSGRPYFVMELVKGIPLTDFCDQHQLTPRQRLELFVPVCQAVQHAHQKGIIHRDLKPSNVLVSRHDTTPVVKVIDFGVAKALGQELTDKTLFTGIAQMVGTPHYMSPEQAGMSDLDVDTRSDVYSLGVLLYELLTGTTPFTKERFKQAAYDEIRRIIREEEPPKPSTRLSESKDALASISAQRHTEPAKLTSLVRGELDWIVMKALEKDRNRRYESANGFAADVQRYLADEPVLACPPSVGYRLRKLVRRNKGPVLAVTLVVLALVGGIVGTTVGMLRAANEASQKNQALEDRTAALTSAEEQLFKALVQRARAERSSGSVGQRFEALKLIQKAARTRITPELRAEAAAALIRPDVEVVHEWEACPEGFLGIPAFDADFMRYARFDKQGEITVCRRTNGPEEILARLRSPGGPIAVGPWMSPDGRYLAVGYRGGAHAGAAEVRVYRLEGSRVEDAFLVPEGIHEWALAYRPDSRQVAIGHANGWVSVYDLERGVRVQRLQIGVSPLCLAFHPRDSRLTVATVNAVRLFDVDKEKELPALRHAVSVRRIESLAWHPDGVRLAVACLDRKIYLWDTRTATEVMTLVDGHEGNVLAFHPAGDLLLSTNYFYQSRVWDVATGRQLLQTPTAIGQQFSRDGRLVGISVAGTKARLWRVAPGRELRVLRRRNAGSLENLVCPVLHPNGRTLAACDRDWLSFFDVISGEELGTASLPHKEAAHPVFFVPPRRSSSQGQAEEAEETGGWMTGGIGSMLFWPTRFDPGRPSVLRVGPARRFVADSGAHSRYASASKDGRVVAVPQGSSTLVIHRDQPERRLVLGPQYDVRFSAVSPDGRWVYSGTHWYDGKSSTARIWDAQTGKLEHELPLDKSTDAVPTASGS
jgi:serine/threonine protein kinase/WD40 repeat protein/gas vesicle protein